MTLTLAALVPLVLAAFVAGVIDAIAGGGGLITVPVLLALPLPVTLALGTNKGGAVWGSGGALLAYARAGRIDRAIAPVAFALGFLGSICGVTVLRRIPSDVLRPIVLVLLVAVALVLAVRRTPVASDAPPAAVRLRRAAFIAFTIGAYDGFFGPGTGTFLITTFVLWLGTPLVRASADAKVVNFASNLAAVCVFAIHGLVLWRIALPMALAQFAGATVGARIAVRGGERVVRYAVLLVVTALVVKLGHDLWVR